MWLELCLSNNMYPWWQSLLFFCAIACSNAHSEKSLFGDSLNFQQIHESSFSKTLLKLLHSPDVQHYVSQIPIWKLQAVLDALSRHMVFEQYSTKSQKRYNSRLFKRAMDPDTFMISFKEAVREAVREILAENKRSVQSKMPDHWSRVEDTGSVKSDAAVNFLRSIGFNSKGNLSDFVPQSSLEYDNSELAQSLQIGSTVRSIFTSKPGGTSMDSEQRLTEQVSVKPQPLLQLSVTTLSPGTTQNFIYSNTITALQSKTFTTIASSSGNASNSRSPTSSDNQSSTTQKSTNFIMKDPLALVTNPVFKHSTLGKILTSNIKTSDVKLGSTRLPITETNGSGLVNLTVTMAAGIFSTDRKISSQIKHSILQNDDTSSPIFISTSPYTKHDLASSTLDMSRLSILPTTRKTFGTSNSFASSNNITDVYQITRTKKKGVPFSKIETTSMVTFITSVTPIKSDFSGTQIIYSHKSTGDGTSEDSGNEKKVANTARTPLSLPSSSPKHTSLLDGKETMEASSFETANNMLSSVSPLPIMGRDHQACELKVHNITTVKTPFMEHTTHENDSTVYSARIKTSLRPKSETSFTGTLAPTDILNIRTLSPFTDSTNPTEESSIVPLVLANVNSLKPTELDPSFSSLNVVFTASPMSTELPNTATVTISEHEIFYDAIPGNVNLNQMPPNVTSTESSTVSAFWFSKLLTSTMPSWEKASPQKMNGSGEITQQTKPTLWEMQSTTVTRPTEYSKPIFLVKNSSVTTLMSSSQALTPNFHTGSFWSTQTAAIPLGSSIYTKPPESSTSYASAHIAHQGQGILGATNAKPRFSQSISPTNLSFAVSQLRNHSTTKALSSANLSEMFTSTIRKLQSSVVPSESTIHAERSVTLQSYNISTMPKKISIFSLNISSQSQAIPKTTPGMSAVSQTVTSTAINVLFAVSQLGNKTTAGPISSKSTSFNTSKVSTNIWTHTPFVTTSKYTSSGVSPSKSTKIVIDTQRTPRRLTVAKRQSSNSFTTPNSSIVSSMRIAQQSQAILNTTHVKSTPQSYTSAIKPLSAASVTRTSLTKTSSKTSQSPGFKIPLDVVAEKSTSMSMSEDLPEIQTTLYATSSSIPVVVAVPLTFQLTGVSYSEQLGNQSTDEYKRLEREVTLVLNKVFATKYQQEFVQVEILGFSKGSIVVKSKILFGSHSSSPSSSDLVRTVLSDDTATKNNVFGWNINASTVDSSGFTPVNLAPESLSISFVVLHFGFIAMSQNYQEKHSYLESIQKEMLNAINKSFPVTNISFSQIRNLYGDLEVRGVLFLKSSTFTNVQGLLSTLLPLANGSVDLLSIAVDGIHNELKVYPFDFRVTNKQFVVNLLDMASTESQNFSKDLSNVIKLALNDNSLLQVVVREFYGSVACKGDLIYRFPAPGSGEVLRQFLQARTSGDLLGSSSFKVDFQSVTIGDSTSSPFNEYTDFPGFAVAIIVMCGLSILISPLLVFVCYKTRMLGHRQKATIRQRHDPDPQSHQFEMDNRAFRASIEQP